MKTILKRLILSITRFPGYIISSFANWISKKKPLFLNMLFTLPIVVIAYLISASFLADGKSMRIIGIILQVLAGIMLASAQIHSNPKIRGFTQRVIEKPHLFAFLVTVVVYAIFLVIILQDEYEGTNIWQGAFGILTIVSISYIGFIQWILAINKIFKKWSGRDELLISGERVSFSLKHVSLVFFASFFLTIGLFLIISLVFKNITAYPVILFVLMGMYAFFIFPPLIISIIFITMYFIARVFGFIGQNEKRMTRFWILVFVIWTWGGLLLILNEIKG